MNNQTILIAVLALIIGGIGGYSMTNKNRMNNNTLSEKMPVGMHSMHDDKMMKNNDSGMGQMDHMMTMMVSSEREFIAGMIPHHQEAVDTAREVIARGGTTPVIKQLVENIVTAQEAEIAEMKVWYETWYKEPYKDNGTYSPMMRELSTLSGKELDRVFLEDMIMHHM